LSHHARFKSVGIIGGRKKVKIAKCMGEEKLIPLNLPCVTTQNVEVVVAYESLDHIGSKFCHIRIW